MIKTLLTAVACVALLTAGAPVKSGYDVGDKVADFKLKNVDGKMVALSDYKNAKGIIVIFDCNTCPYSQKYNDRIINLSRIYSKKDFNLITIQPNDPKISPGDSYDKMKELANRKDYDFPYLFDETQQVARAFGATNTPQAFILKRSGNDFIVAYIGAIDDNAKDASAVTNKYVENAVNALLTGKEPEVTKTKVLGCTIKWRE
ncbi:MAG: thioredoxin family protein [Flammeovirgaceae bacterium]|jgi:peroxiredoxin|nr:MAG: thioredoxin family protein [Flammeovirgaceae bacterium]